MRDSSRGWRMTAHIRGECGNVPDRTRSASVTRSLLLVVLWWTMTPLLIAPVEAQSGITGRVIADSTRRPLADADVSIRGGSADSSSVRTDSTGRFRLPLPVSGSFRLQVRRAGYEVLTTVALTPEMATAGPIELVLRPARGN